MTSAEELRYRILAAQREGERRLAAALKPLGLTPSQAEALRRIGEAQPVSLAGLGRLLVCEKGSPSRLVAGLTARRWVRSVVNPAQRREVRLALTPAGETLAAEVARVEAAFHAAIADAAPAATLDAALALLRALTVGTAGGEAIASRGGPTPDRGSAT